MTRRKGNFILNKKNGFVAGIFAFFVILAFSYCTYDDSAVAAGFTWDGGGSGNLCSTKENWVGDVAPGSGSSVVFDTTSSKSVTLDCAISGIQIDGYTGNITMAQNISVSGYDQNSGNFSTTANYTLTVSSGFTKTGGIFGQNLTLAGANVSNTAGSFGSGLMTVSGSVSVGSDLNWTGSLLIDEGATLGGGAYNLAFGSNAVNNGVLSGTGTWTMSGDFTNSVTGQITSTPGDWYVKEDLLNQGSITNQGNFIYGAGRNTDETRIFDPGGAVFNNLEIRTWGFYGFSYVYVPIDIARDVTVLGDLLLSDAGKGFIQNPATAKTITVYGNLTKTGQDGTIGGNNLTFDLMGSGKTFSYSGGTFKSNLLFSGFNTSISATGPFGDSTTAFTVANDAVTALSNISLGFGSITVNEGATFEVAAYSLTTPTNTTVVNSGTLSGSASWVINGNFTNEATGTVSAPSSWNVKKNFTNNGSIVHNNGTLNFGDGSYSGNPTYTFSPGSSDYYNVTFLPTYLPGNYTAHNAVANSFSVLGDLTFGSSADTGSVDDPASPLTITVWGNVNVQNGTIGGPNLTVSMVGTEKTLFETNGYFKSNMIVAGSGNAISSNGGTFGSNTTPAVATFAVSGSDNTVTLATDLTLNFASLTVEAGNILAIGAKNFVCSSSTNVINNGTLTGTTGTWDFKKNFTNGSTGSVSAPAAWDVENNFTNNGTVLHNNGTLTFGDGSHNGSPTYTFDPGSSDYYNLIFAPSYWPGNATAHNAIARSFNVMNDLIFGKEVDSGAIDNPASPVVITVAGNVTTRDCTTIGGPNLTIEMVGESKTLSAQKTISFNLGVSGNISVSRELKTNNNIAVTEEGVFNLYAFPLTSYSSATVTNNGFLAGTGTWGIEKDFVNGATGSVSAPSNWTVEKNFTNSGNFIHNSGTLTVGNGTYSGSPTYTFDPGDSDYYNLILAPDYYSGQTAHLRLVRSFDILGNLTLGTDETWNGSIDNPAALVRLNVGGNAYLRKGTIGGANLTLNMMGNNGTVFVAGTQFQGNLLFSGSGSNISVISGNLGTSTGTMTIADPGNTVTLLTNLTIYFGNITINNGATLDAGNKAFGTGSSTGLTNSGTIRGTGVWNTDGNFTNNADGTVEATSATWNHSRNFTNNGTFHHNNGTVVMDFNNSGYYLTTNNNTTFYNLTFSHSGSTDRSDLAGSGLTVVNNLHFGLCRIYNPTSLFTITAEGNVTVSGGLVGYSAGNNVTINMTGSGKTFSITSGTLYANLNFIGSNTSITQSGGSFGTSSSTVTIGGSSHTVTVLSNLTEYYGNFIVSSSNVLDLKNFSFVTGSSSTSVLTNNGTMKGTGAWNIDYVFVNNGMVEAPASINFSKNFTNNGNFTHNNGTVTFDADNSGFYHNFPTSMTFYNLNFAHTSGSNRTDLSGLGFTVENNLSFGTSRIYKPASLFTINAQGNVAFNGGLVGYSSNGNLLLKFSGSKEQTFSYSSGTYYGDIEIDKSGGQVVQTTNLPMSAAGQDFAVTNGTYFVNGSSLIVNGTGSVFSNQGTLKLVGGETLTFTRDTDSGTVEYVGTGANSYASLNYGNNYHNLKINSASGTNSFTAAAATVVNNDFTLNAGTFVAPATTLTVSRNFNHSGGIFTHNSGTVILNTTNTANVTGSTTFNNLTSSVGGKTINFGAGDTQTVLATTTLNGSAGNNLILRSTSSPAQGRIDPQGTRNISYVDVKDSNNINPLSIGPTNSVDSYNNTNWFSYTVTASAGANGSISPDGITTYDSGSSPVYNLLPETGYHVADVLVDSVSVGTPTSHTFTDIAANHTISATFAINTYTITATSGANGSISPSGETVRDYGSDQTYTITADEHYHIAEVVVDDVSAGTPSSYTFNDIAANHTIEVTFAIDTFSITITTDNANGNVTPNGKVMVDYGADQTFTITPNDHYHIADVVVDGVSVGKPLTYTLANVTANHTINASFAIDTYTIIASAGANGSISPSGNSTSDYGTSQIFAINADPGFEVSEILVDGTAVSKADSYTFSNITAAHTISVSFASIPVQTTITTIPAGVTTTTIDDDDDDQGENEDDQDKDEDEDKEDSQAENGGGTAGDNNNDQQEKPKKQESTILGKITENISQAINSVISAMPPVLVRRVQETAESVKKITVETVKKTPPPVAYSFPYFLFVLLGLVALNFLYQTKNEVLQARRLLQDLEREKLISEEKEEFLRLAVHYLRTPIAIMRGSVELMEFKKINVGSLKQAILDLASTAEKILHKIEANRKLSRIKEPDKRKETIRIFTSFYLWCPVLAIGGLAVLANYLFVTVAKIDINIINFIVEAVMFVIVFQLFVNFFRKRQIEKHNRKEAEKLAREERAIDQARNEYIKETSEELRSSLEIIKKNHNDKQIEISLTKLEKMLSHFDMLAEVKAGDKNEILTLQLESPLEKILIELGKEITNKGLIIKKDLREIELKTDQRKLEYVLKSLIENAVKFNKNNGRVEISTNQGTGTITVKDSGIGIEKKKMDYLFKPFLRATSSLKFDYEGLGFSLFLSKIIVENLGGQLLLSSQLGEGTTVRIVLPNN